MHVGGLYFSLTTINKTDKWVARLRTPDPFWTKHKGNSWGRTWIKMDQNRHFKMGHAGEDAFRHGFDVGCRLFFQY
jgi:tricorn protease-like protein